MALKTFNLDDAVYKEFSEHCKKNGISMSKKVENFIREEVEGIKSGARVTRTRIVKEMKDFDGLEKEHSFKKYC